MDLRRRRSAPSDRSRSGAARAAPLRLSAFYAAFFVVVGTLQPFWPLWLEARGLGATEIGLVLAIGVGAKVIGLPIAAHVADRSGQRQRPMLSLAIASTLAFALFAAAGSYWTIVLVSLLFFSLWPPVMSLAESLTMMAGRAQGFEYGRVRLWGSLSYIATAVAGGVLLERLPADAVFWMILAGVGLTAVTCALLPDLRADRSPAGRLPMLDVIRGRRFWLAIVACGLIQGSHAVYYAFGTIHWQSAGFSEALIGALWAEGVVCEVILFAFGAGLVRRLGAAGLIAISGVAGTVRWLGTGLTDDLAIVVVLQTLHAASFGGAHLAAMHWIGAEMPPALSASAQSLYSAVVWGVFLGAMLFVAGLLYADLAGHAYLPMAAVAFAGAGFGLALLLSDRGGE